MSFDAFNICIYVAQNYFSFFNVILICQRANSLRILIYSLSYLKLIVVRKKDSTLVQVAMNFSFPIPALYQSYYYGYTDRQ